MRFADGRYLPAYSPAVAEFERTADLEPGQYAAGDKSERFCTEPGCTYPASIKCAHFGCPQRRAARVAGGGRHNVAPANVSSLLHPLTDSAGEQHNHHA